MRALPFLTGVLMAPRDGQSVVICPFDVDIFLLHTGKFSIQLVTCLRLLDVELGRKGAHTVELTINVFESLPVVLVEEAKNGSELLRESGEERHCCR